jgi:hypothetical protein
MDPPGYERRLAKRASSSSNGGGPAAGRGQPPTQQGMIVATVSFSRDEYKERADNVPIQSAAERAKAGEIDTPTKYAAVYGVQAPLGDKACFQAMQGELAFAVVDDYGVTERNCISQDSQLKVTTTVNALRTDQDGCFGGIVRNARPL